jgi:hypothetical protein
VKTVEAPDAPKVEDGGAKPALRVETAPKGRVEWVGAAEGSKTAPTGREGDRTATASVLGEIEGAYRTVSLTV